MSDDCGDPPLEECPVCGAIGLPERIQVHNCPAFYASRRWGHAPLLPSSEGTTDGA